MIVRRRGVRVKCFMCGKFYALKADGKFRVHKALEALEAQNAIGDCLGSGHAPEPNAEEMEER